MYSRYFCTPEIKFSRKLYLLIYLTCGFKDTCFIIKEFDHKIGHLTIMYNRDVCTKKAKVFISTSIFIFLYTYVHKYIFLIILDDT